MSTGKTGENTYLFTKFTQNRGFDKQKKRCNAIMGGGTASDGLFID